MARALRRKSTATPSETAAAGGLTSTPVPPVPGGPGGAGAGQPPDSAGLAGVDEQIRFDPRVQIGRSGLKQYGGFIFEEFLQTLRGQNGAKAYRELIENSPLVGGILRLLELTLRQVKKHVTPFSKQAADVKIAERIDQGLDDMSSSWADYMAEISTMLGYGFAPMEIVWKRCEGFAVDGTRSRFDDGLIMPRKIFLMGQDTLFRWSFDVDGGVKAMVQLAPPDYVMRTIPIEKMLLFRPRIEKGNPEGQSLLRSGYFSWVIIKRLIEYEAIAAERDAVGLPVVSIPGINMIPGADLTVFNMYKKVAQNIRIDDQMGMVIPSDCYPGTNIRMFEVSLLGTHGRTVNFNYGEVITRHEVRLAISMLADILLLGHDKVGSFALSHDKRSMLGDALGAWLDSICGVHNRHLFPRIYALNGWPLDRLCTLGHGGVQADAINELADAIQKLGQAGMPLFPDLALENHIRAEAGLPERAEDADLGAMNGAGRDPSRDVARDPNDDDPDEPDTAKPVGQKPTAAGEKKPFGKFRGQPRTRRGPFQPISGTVATALHFLQERAKVGPGDSINHGFHIAAVQPYDERKVSAGAIDAAPLERLKLKDLTATQPTVRRDGVRNFLDNPGVISPGQRNLSGELVDRPVVVRTGGKAFIHDGHHRLAARVLMGNDDALARVVDLDGE